MWAVALRQISTNGQEVTFEELKAAIIQRQSRPPSVKADSWRVTAECHRPCYACSVKDGRSEQKTCSIIPFPTWCAWNSDLINDTLTGGSRSLHSAPKQSRRVAGCFAVETVYRHLFCLALAFHESSERCPSPVSPTGHLNLSKKIAPRGGSLGPSNIFLQSQICVSALGSHTHRHLTTRFPWKPGKQTTNHPWRMF